MVNSRCIIAAPIKNTREQKQEQNMITGGCLCGRVKYQYDGDINEIAMCHCSQCRKAQGGPFATNSPITSQNIEFSGQHFIREYQSNDDKVRAFCSHCGSPLYSRLNSNPDIKRLRIGTVESPIQCTKRYHIFTASKADWDTISDDYPQHKER